MDTRAQLEAERKRLEAALLTIEQERLCLVPKDCDAVGPETEDLLSSLGLVNAELAAIRHRDEMSRRA